MLRTTLTLAGALALAVVVWQPSSAEAG